LLLAVVTVTASACGGSRGLRAGASVDDVAVSPRLANGEEVQAAIEAEYPPELRAAGVQGVVRLSLLVSEDGVPVDYRVLQGSGFPALDRAAGRVARVLRFEPARDSDGDPLQVWASFPIVFSGG
jgi:TonB family protein